MAKETKPFGWLVVSSSTLLRCKALPCGQSPDVQLLARAVPLSPQYLTSVLKAAAADVEFATKDGILLLDYL